MQLIMRTKCFLAMVLLWALLLVGCSLNLPQEGLPEDNLSPVLAVTQTPSITVPPLNTPTTWSTRTPLPTFTPSATPPICWKTGGSLEEIEVFSTILDQPVPLLIYLPPCYTQLPELSYPTLYLIHGQGFTKEQWVEMGMVKLINRWVAIGDAPPVIIVMPQISEWSEPDSFPFGQALVEEIIPVIEGRYRALPFREDRKVGGISRGASWALHLGLKYWQTFSAIGAHSLPVFYSDAPSLPDWLDAIPADLRPLISLDYAVSDMSAIRRSTDRLIVLLEERSFSYHFFTAPGTHDQEYWKANLEEYLQFYLEGW